MNGVGTKSDKKERFIKIVFFPKKNMTAKYSILCFK